MNADTVIEQTRRWLEEAVIGLNLCPFAKAVHVKGLVRYVVSAAVDERGLLADLVEQLRELAAADPAMVDTTLLIHPGVLQEFGDFNQFLGEAEDTVDALGLAGVLQVASFHPQFQFAGTLADDVGNASNRSPYPTLHLLREDSIDRAVKVFPQAETIYEANIRTLQALGREGWSALSRRWAPGTVPARNGPGDGPADGPDDGPAGAGAAQGSDGAKPKGG